MDTEALFTIAWEKGKLRVRNENINCLYANLDPQSFDEAYNRYLRYLNPDFEPVVIEGIAYALDENERERFIQQFITNWIYFYTINDLEVQVQRSDFEHPWTLTHMPNSWNTVGGFSGAACSIEGATIENMEFFSKLEDEL